MHIVHDLIELLSRPHLSDTADALTHTYPQHVEQEPIASLSDKIVKSLQEVFVLAFHKAEWQVEFQRYCGFIPQPLLRAFIA